MPYDLPWDLFTNTTLQWFAWYQLPHNLPPYRYLGSDFPADFFCWGLPGNTLPLGNWDPFCFQQVSEMVVRKYRVSELKHARIAMLACVGMIVQELAHPLYEGRMGGLAITHMQQWRDLHGCGLLLHILPDGIRDGLAGKTHTTHSIIRIAPQFGFRFESLRFTHSIQECRLTTGP